MRLLLVRHAESEANAEGRVQGHADFGLSQRGRAQAEILGASLSARDFVPTHVYSSPLRRSAETAAILARSWQASIMPWGDLKEHDVGVMSGLTWDEAADRFPDIDRELETARQLSGVPGAEPLHARRARAQRVVDAVIADHAAGDVIAIVSHGGILQQILAALLGTRRTWGVPIENTAVFDVELDPARWDLDGDHLDNTAACRINRFNDSSHLLDA